MNLVERALALYREEDGTTGLFENRVYDGVARMLDDVGPAASGSFVATLKPKPYADRIVHRLGLEPYFAGVNGPGMDERGEKGELLAHLLTTAGIPAERAVMIGDREGDILAAHANGTWSIGVLWGYGSESELADVRPDALCASPGELASRVLRIAGSRPSR